ncbi:DNA-binding response regulator, NarL/FixJ family, contains REC and HTH domains [Lentzea waywayandensis]|uniref:DNA-binding response regulator, NarL/FixJ family, contains REC and HTH domains n=1 Tax=Lentzea waywayandensis TaxID=84724 RepID=A0A1I6FA73_9PSEU|nr:response regulator transcription factor [Lentzea waywayandensis]SFR26703.1 DNA-binding response regulator, NarL/FixJ family, contains REC and HTH domains [Lentzea waywayandensis]
MVIRVVVVDGHALTRFGLKMLAVANTDLEFVAEANTAADAPAVIAAATPNVVTVAVGLPDGDGLRLARDLRDRHPALGIVVMTSHGEDDVLFRALETGASAFVGKTAPIEEILCAIRHAAVAASSFTAAGLANAMARRQASRLVLSPREREVLDLLRDGVSIPAIARTLYVSPSTAKTYVSRLYEKLGVSNRAQALMAALRMGLIHSDAATA